jgi:hypothetical protein
MGKFLYRRVKASYSPSGIVHFVSEWFKTALISALFLAEEMFHFSIDYRFEKSDILLFAPNNCTTTTTSTTTTTTSLLVLGDPGRLGRIIYVVTVETSRQVEARHT